MANGSEGVQPGIAMHPIGSLEAGLPEMTPGSVIATPQEVRDSAHRLVGHLKIEHAVVLDGHAIVIGWSVGDFIVDLLVDGQCLVDAREVRFERSDVATHFEKEGSEQHGFALVVPCPESRVITVRWGVGTARTVDFLSLEAVDIDHPGLEQVVPEIAPVLALGHAPFSGAWSDLIKRARPVPGNAARGFLEAAATFQGSGLAAVVGWVVADPNVPIWLQDDEGGVHTLDAACWRSRADVYDATGGRFGAAALQSGFVALLECPEDAANFQLLALTEDGLQLVGEITGAPIAAESRAVSRWLFGIEASDGERLNRFNRIGHPLLSRLRTREQAAWPALPTTHRKYGAAIEAPLVSVIVPLHGRFDFVEGQMLEWARDPWIQRHAQLIYVLDDPQLVDGFHGHAEELFRLYGVPFEWIWGGVNRGFSGANNLGVSLAKASHLLFLNSDVFPRQPGWLAPLLDTLAERAEIGVVGPRLVFAEGGIQHAGMRFERLERYAVWINRHPNIGLDPALDPAQGLTLVPAVTGACMLVRRRDFDAIGGWDAGYLIGDFEDSDFCLRMAQHGLRSAYLPTVQLTHLERQSMRELGSPGYRMQVTLWNAMRHQHLWGDVIAGQIEACP